MRGPWNIIPPDDMEIVAPGGEIRGIVKAHFGGSVIVVPDQFADIRSDDEMRRKLPNGNDEVFVVTEAAFFKGAVIPPHYQVKFRRAGSQPHHQGGNFTLNLNGPNARVSINSTDNSVNIVGEEEG
ncbi:MAG: hypothetical protein JWM33_2384 [Caulobacteraceae bacterium]|nr:hypothetical protein [Caulobacteraceae bacterium]